MIAQWRKENGIYESSYFLENKDFYVRVTESNYTDPVLHDLPGFVECIILTSNATTYIQNINSIFGYSMFKDDKCYVKATVDEAKLMIEHWLLMNGFEIQ